jgi:hypothetical protein
MFGMPRLEKARAISKQFWKKAAVPYLDKACDLSHVPHLTKCVAPLKENMCKYNCIDKVVGLY